MAITIGTNPTSLNAQRNLAQSQSSLTASIQRLTSGMRINTAKDDSAGSAISNRFNSQIKGLNQAVRNSNDGISMAQTAEGALQETTNLLQRMRELAVQAVNDTNTQSDRGSIQSEMDQLFKEVDRIAGTTKFNGKALLDGTANNSTFQVGANAGETLSVSVKAATTKSLNLNGYSALGELNGGRVGATALASTTAGILINGVAITKGTSAEDSAQEKAAVINEYTQQTGVRATAYNTLRGSSNITGITTGMTVNGAAIAASGGVDELVSNINRDATGVTAIKNSDNSISLSNDTGADIIIAGTTGATSGFTNGTYTGYVSLTAADGSNIELQDSTVGGELAKYGFNAGTGSSTVTGTATTASKLLATDLVTVNGVRVGDSADSSAAAKAAAINAVNADTGVTAAASTTVTGSGGTGTLVKNASLTGGSSANILTNIATVTANSLSINGVAITFTAATTVASVVAVINAATLQTNVTASVASGKLVLSSSGTERDVVTTGTAAATLGLSGNTDNTRTSSFTGTALTTAIAAGFDGTTNMSITVGGVATTVTLTAAQNSAEAIVAKINSTAGVGARASIESGYLRLTANDPTKTISLADVNTGGALAALGLNAAAGTPEYGSYGDRLKINGTDIMTSGATTDMNALATRINSSVQGVVASVSTSGNLQLSSNTGLDVKVEATQATAAKIGLTVSTVNSTGTGDGFVDTTTTTGKLTLTSDTGGTVTVGSDASTEAGKQAAIAKIGLVQEGGSEEVVGSGLSVMTAANASNAINRIDEALANVDSNRGNLGAFQNRLTSTINNLTNVSENLSVARGRIIDADFAQETANMTKQNILQQAGIAMLSQSNQNAQQVLSLLR
ncbi:MAG: flagellin [Candidatus Competibacteraceae bacterium]